MNPNPLEKEIEKRVCAFAKSLHCYERKFTSPSRRAVPDRLIITPNGIVFFIEFKRQGELPTMSQTVEIEKIRQHGVPVYVVDNVAEGRRVVEEMVAKVRDPMF